MEKVEQERPLTKMFEESRQALNNGHSAVRSGNFKFTVYLFLHFFFLKKINIVKINQGADFESFVANHLMDRIASMCGFEGFSRCAAENEPLPAITGRKGINSFCFQKIFSTKCLFYIYVDDRHVDLSKSEYSQKCQKEGRRNLRAAFNLGLWVPRAKNSIKKSRKGKSDDNDNNNNNKNNDKNKNNKNNDDDDNNEDDDEEKEEEEEEEEEIQDKSIGEIDGLIYDEVTNDVLVWIEMKVIHFLCFLCFHFSVLNIFNKKQTIKGTCTRYCQS